MANPNFQSTTTTNFGTDVGTYSIDSKTTDGIYAQEENKWINPDAQKYYGFYYNVGEYRAAVNSYGTWVIGQGFTADAATTAMLGNIIGWGEDTFQHIMWNMVVTKKFSGDSYAHIIRNEETGTLINLKTLDPKRMAHITNEKGLITFYEYSQGDGVIKRYNPEEILHFCNDRILDEPHGTAVTSAVEWVLTAIEQARRDWQRIMHFSSVRVMYVDEQDVTKQNKIKTEFAVGIKKGDVVMVTGKKEDLEFLDLVVPPAQAWTMYLNYLEDKLYKQLGVPKVVLGGTAENTEASSKIGVLVYEPVWTREISELEADLWNQLAIRIKVNKQPSMMDTLQTQEGKNNAQTGFQPNDVKAGVGK